jgi:hypothetical protein
MIKLRDHLNVPIGMEEKAKGRDRFIETGYQLALPFDETANLELRITRRGEDWCNWRLGSKT